MMHTHARFLRLVLLPALVINLLAYGLIVTLFQPQAAHAQAYVIGSDPVDGSTVVNTPHNVRIFFDNTISSLSTAIIQYVQNGEYVSVEATSTVSLTNPRELDIPMPTNSPQGSYLVSWTAISMLDGRTTYGKIGFNIGHSYMGLSGQVVLGPSSSNDFDVRNLDLLGTLSIAWEWLVLVALVFWIGVLVIERLALPRTERVTVLLDRARRHTQPLQSLCLSALLIGEIITLLLREVHITRALYDGTLDFSALLPFLMQTTYGWLWIARFCLLLVALGVFWWLSRPYQKLSPNETPPTPSLPGLRRSMGLPKTTVDVADRPSRPPVTATKSSILTPSQETLYSRPVTIIWFVFTLLLLGTYAVTDTQVTQVQVAAMVFDGLSLLAWGAWFGGLAYLAYVLLPLLPAVESDNSTEILAASLRNMTPYLLGGIAIELVCLLFLSEATIPTSAQWLSDPYGRALLVLLLLVGVALLLTLYTLLVVRPRLAREAVLLPVVNADMPARRSRQNALGRKQRSLRQLVSLQTILGACALLCTTLMLFYAPPVVFPNIVYSNSSANSSTPAQTQSAGGLKVTLLVTPGHVNTTNTVTIHLTDDNGSPVTNAQVQLITTMATMDMGTSRQTAQRGGSDNATYTARFVASDAFSMSGVWDVRVIIQRPGHANVTLTFPVPVG